MPTQIEKKDLLETVARMDERMQGMAEDIRQLKDSIPNWVRANTAIYGTGEKSGLLYDVRTVKEKVSDLEAWKMKFTAKVSVISTIVGIALMFLKDYLLGEK